MTNDFIYMNRCLRSTLVFFCWLQYIWDLKYQFNTCAGHHYQKGLHGSWYYNLTMLPSHTYMFGYLFIFKVFFFFWCGLSLKTLLNLLQNCFCFMLWFSGLEACGILAPQLGTEPAAPALESEVLTHQATREVLFLLFKF